MIQKSTHFTRALVATSVLGAALVSTSLTPAAQAQTVDDLG